MVREKAQSRYDEGYERGLHDTDATLILEKLVAMRTSAGLLRFPAHPRGLAALFWGAQTRGSDSDKAKQASWQRKSRNLVKLRERFGHSPALRVLGDALATAMTAWLEQTGLTELLPHATLAGQYLLEELAAPQPKFTTSRDAEDLRAGLMKHLEETDGKREFEQDLRILKDDMVGRLELAIAWAAALAGADADAGLIFETAVAVAGDAVDREVSSAVVRTELKGLLGQHPRVKNGAMPVQLDEFIARLSHFREVWAPGYQRYRALRHDLLEDARVRLRLNEFKPRVMSSFVRNKLINDVYLPIVGDNFAKQMGAAGDNKRTDLMGLLLLMSPPGYGKTTLMEYVANRLGLVFVKVNGPSLGHAVTSLDPAEAPNATARQEVEKINLAFEMANNVMLYLDDIQHTDPELLQKFISLCDGQRKIEGVWREKTRTYDMRGKKFCVIMAGNPYTETGSKFTIPDMLANRADTYNLGDVLDGREEVFSLSYVENSLTSNPVLAPLASRDQGDVYKLIRMAQGEEIPTTDLSHGYSAVEVTEIVAVLKRMFAVQDVVMKVNGQYVASAAQDDAFRTEPMFKLQGSYRNMNKMAEKLVSAMNADEVQGLIDDHYAGESQTLTTGAENNLLKLAELRDRMSPEQMERWGEIKRGFKRVQISGGKDDDPATRVAGTLSGIAEQLSGLKDALGGNDDVTQALAAINATILNASIQTAQSKPAAQGGDVAVARALAGIHEQLARGGNAELVNAVSTMALKLDGIRSTVAKAAQKMGQPVVHKAAPLGAKPLPALGGRPLGGLQPRESSADSAVLLQVVEALKAVGRPQVEIQMPPPAGIDELLAQQVAIVERTLVPLVKASAANLQDAQAIGRSVEELIALLKQVDAKMRR